MSHGGWETSKPAGPAAGQARPPRRTRAPRAPRQASPSRARTLILIGVVVLLAVIGLAVWRAVDHHERTAACQTSNAGRTSAGKTTVSCQ